MIPLGWDPAEVALEASIANWELSVRRVDEFAAKLRPDQLLDVRYEDLVLVTEDGCETLTDFPYEL